MLVTACDWHGALNPMMGQLHVQVIVVGPNDGPAPRSSDRSRGLSPISLLKASKFRAKFSESYLHKVTATLLMSEADHFISSHRGTNWKT